MTPRIFKTKGTNPENGKPNVVALMFDESRGVSLDGGAMSAGVHLGFGDTVPFDPSQWVELTEDEYGALLVMPSIDGGEDGPDPNPQG